MRSHGSLVFCALCVIVCFAAGTAYSQQPTTSAEVGSVIEALRQAPAYERAEKRAEVVLLGDLAIDPLIAAVEARQSTEDGNLVSNCIIALGELKAAKATDVLVQVLGEGNLPLACLAARSLGQIWEAKGPQEPQVKPVNAALLALLHSELPAVGVYPPGLALRQVNAIPLNRPESMSADQLRERVSEWFGKNPDALPPAAQRPWQLNVYVALKGSDDAARQQAIRALQQQRELGCIEPILAAVADGTAPQDAVGQDLVKLVGELTGVAFPPAGMAGGAGPSEQVEQWRGLWFAQLASQTDQRHVDYALRGLEESLRRYEEAPTEDGAKPVKFFRAALLNQLPGPQAMPASLSPKAKDMLAGSLETKGIVANAVAALGDEVSPFAKNTQLRVIEDRSRGPWGREVAALFLGRLYDLAYDEQNASVAAEMGNVIAKISGIPCNLTHSQIDVRRARLAEWLRAGQALGLAADATRR